MITLNELQDEWTSDCKIDELNFVVFRWVRPPTVDKTSHKGYKFQNSVPPSGSHDKPRWYNSWLETYGMKGQ